MTKTVDTKKEILKKYSEDLTSKIFSNVYKSEAEFEIPLDIRLSDFLSGRKLATNVKFYLETGRGLSELRTFTKNLRAKDTPQNNAGIKTIIELALAHIYESILATFDKSDNEILFKIAEFLTNLKNPQSIKANHCLLKKAEQEKLIEPGVVKLLWFTNNVAHQVYSSMILSWDMFDIILKVLTEELKKRSEAEAHNKTSENYIEYRQKVMLAKNLPVEELIQKARAGSDADIKQIIEAFVKLKYSFKDLKQSLDDLKINVSPDVLSTHYILSGIQTVNKHKWDLQENAYVILGNLGVGKSSLLHYFRSNIDAARVDTCDSWSVKWKEDRQPMISHKPVEAQTVIPWHYKVNVKKSELLIYDTPGFFLSDSYEQEIVSAYSLKMLLQAIGNPKIIPCFSYEDLLGKATSFIKFLEIFSKLLQDKSPSIYFVTKAKPNQKPKILAMLKRIAEAIPLYSDMIEDICQKLEFFSAPVNGKFAGEAELSNIQEKLLKMKPTAIKPKLPISDGAKNKTRELLDTWDIVLKQQFDNFFDRIVKPLTYEYALTENIKILQEFAKLSNINEVPDFLYKRAWELSEDTEENNAKGLFYILIAETIISILPYRHMLKELSEMRDSGIFEAYFSAQIDRYTNESKYLMQIMFLRELHNLKCTIQNKISSGYCLKESNKWNLVRYSNLNITLGSDDLITEEVKDELGIRSEFDRISSLKDKLLFLGWDETQELQKSLGEICENLRGRKMIILTYLKNIEEITKLKDLLGNTLYIVSYLVKSL